MQVTALSPSFLVDPKGRAHSSALFQSASGLGGDGRNWTGKAAFPGMNALPEEKLIYTSTSA